MTFIKPRLNKEEKTMLPLFSKITFTVSLGLALLIVNIQSFFITEDYKRYPFFDIAKRFIYGFCVGMVIGIVWKYL